MTPTLETIGQALYGNQWQRDLARALGVADRTMRRWYSGATPIPSGAYADMQKLCLERSAELKTLAGRLECP
jgi:hypothetical protein